MTTRTSARNDGGLFRGRGAGLSRPAARERSGRAPPTPGDWPRFPEYVVARRYAVRLDGADSRLGANPAAVDNALPMTAVDCSSLCEVEIRWQLDLAGMGAAMSAGV